MSTKDSILLRSAKLPCRHSNLLTSLSMEIPKLEDKNDWDLIVLGGGPTGLTAALTAADAGFNVAIVDGTPAGQTQFSGPTGLFSKALRDSAKRVKVKTLREMGLLDSSIWKQVVDLTKNIVSSSGSKNLDAVMANRVTHERATAVLLPDDDPELSTLEVTCLDSDKKFSTKCKKLLIATGSSPNRLRNLDYDGKMIFDSDDIKKLDFLPKSMIIVGSGIIAIEYAKIFATLETKVTIVIRADDYIAPLSRIGIDSAISEALVADLKASGVEIVTEAEVGKVEKPAEGTGMKVSLHKAGTEQVVSSLEADIIMTAAGRGPNSKGLGLEEAGVELGRGNTIVVDGDLKTSVPGVYAAGDVVGPPSLASTGIEQAQTAVRRMFDQEESSTGTWLEVDPGAGKDPQSLISSPLSYPVGIWTIPELSFIGYTKESAIAQGYTNVAEGVAYYANTIRGRVQGVDQGLMKIVFSKPDGRILGIHIFGEDACELVHYGTALAQSEKTVRDVLGVTFTAVTFHELFAQAAQDAINQLDADSWTRILETIGLPCSADKLETGLVEAGMNTDQANQFIQDVNGADGEIQLADAQALARRFRVPSKYKMIQVLKRQLTSEGSGEAKRVYKSVAKSSSGGISATEIMTTLKMQGLEVEESEVSRLVEETCGSDKVCAENFDVIYTKVMNSEAGTKLSAKRMFDLIDADNSGEIDKNELLEFLKRRGIVFSERGAEDLMSSVDSDGGGNLCYEEFYEVFRALFQYRTPRAEKKVEAAAK